MDMAADFTLKVTLPPSSGKGAAMSISVMPGYQSGQRLASLKSAMVSCGEALIWTLRCTIAIVDLPALCCRTPFRHARVYVPAGVAAWRENEQRRLDTLPALGVVDHFDQLSGAADPALTTCG